MADFVRVPESDWQAICDAVREKTGGENGLLSGVLAAMISSIQAGAGALSLPYDMGEFVLDADIQFVNTADSMIVHELGEAPDFVLVWTEEFSDLTAENPSPYTTTTSLGYLYLRNLIGLPQRLTSAANTEYALQMIFSIYAGGYVTAANVPTSPSYGVTEFTAPTEQRIGLTKNANNHFWRSGITYKYFVSKAWWASGGIESAE